MFPHRVDQRSDVLDRLRRCFVQVILVSAFHYRNRMHEQCGCGVMHYVEEVERTRGAGPETGLRRITHGIIVLNAMAGQVQKGIGQTEFQEMLS